MASRLVAPVAVTVCCPRLAFDGMVIPWVNDPVPSAVAVPTTALSNVIVTVSFGEKPRPFTVVVLPGGPEEGLTWMHGTNPVTVVESVPPFEYENV